VAHDELDEAPRPQVWELVSAELDGNGLVVTLKLETEQGTRGMTFEYPVTSFPAVQFYRELKDIIEGQVEDLGKTGIVITPIEPNDPDERYHELTGP
jgi:hypothetical protein